MPWKPIQAQAAAFFQLLGLKNMGRFPEVLLEEVRPTLNMEPWYLRTIAERHLVNTGVANITSFGVLPLWVVPENEWWFVQSLNISLQQPGTATDIEVRGLRAAISGPNRGVVTGEAYPIVEDAAAAGRAFSFTPRSLEGVWVPPNCSIGYCADVAILNDGGGLPVGQVVAQLCRSPVRV